MDECYESHRYSEFVGNLSHCDNCRRFYMPLFGDSPFDQAHSRKFYYFYPEQMSQSSSSQSSIQSQRFRSPTPTVRSPGSLHLSSPQPRFRSPFSPSIRSSSALSPSIRSPEIRMRSSISTRMGEEASSSSSYNYTSNAQPLLHPDDLGEFVKTLFFST